MQRHFTATAFVVDSHNRVLLLWHKRLERWMPPGGHVDPDETPEDASARECKEETGLDVEIVGESQENMFAHNPHEGRMLKKPFALLLENIPESRERNEPMHQHMDFVFIARPIHEEQETTLALEEGSKLRWFSREEIMQLNTETEIFANVKTYIFRILKEKP
jgi:8-oxo-dGTP pyrophosphatase MutT (NUDIX family)